MERKRSANRTHSRLAVLLLGILAIAWQIVDVSASADYAEAMDYELHQTGGNSEMGDSSGDDIYDAAALQQEVETSERKEVQRATIDAKTDASTKDVLNISNNQIYKEYASAEHENITEDDNLTSSEEYYDNVQAVTTPRANRPSIIRKSTTTSIPDYVHKGKGQSFALAYAPAASPGDGDDETLANASLSDYIEDEAHGMAEVKQKQKILTQILEDDIVPLAMKFYHDTGAVAADEDNNLKEQHAIAAPQQQLLPHQQREHVFQQNISHEEYYEDSREDVVDHMPKQTANETATSSKATPSPNSDAWPMPLHDYNAPIERAAFGRVPLAFSAAATSTPTPMQTQTTATMGTATTSATTNSPPEPTPAPATFASESTSMAATTTAPPVTAFMAPTTAPTTMTPTTMTMMTMMMTTTTTGTVTTVRPAGKQAKQINITRRKLMPHEQLRNYIEDAYIRMPLAVIVDPSVESLEKTKALWRDALRTNLNIKIVLVALNASGVPAAYNFNSTRQFLAGLNSIKEHVGGDAFVGIVHASELVPYDSAVFISTAKVPFHTELVQDAAITLLKKRIRLYVIWHGDRSSTENETQEAVGGILGEVAIRSGGEILHIVGSENSQELEGNTLILVADAFRGSQELEIPVDTTLSSLHVKIDEPMRTATLETPNGG